MIYSERVLFYLHAICKIKLSQVVEINENALCWGYLR